jgi:hypothetical protein
VEREGAPHGGESEPSVNQWASTSPPTQMDDKCESERKREGATSQEVGNPPLECAPPLLKRGTPPLEKILQTQVTT